MLFDHFLNALSQAQSDVVSGVGISPTQRKVDDVKRQLLGFGGQRIFARLSGAGAKSRVLNKKKATIKGTEYTN